MGCLRLDIEEHYRPTLKVVHGDGKVAQRWLSTDPLAVERASLTPYNYVSGNPINRIDPDGRLDGWVQGDEGVFWDPNTNSQAEFDSNYSGREGFSYVSDKDNANSYSLPSGEGRLVMNSWSSDVDRGAGSASINMEFIPSDGSSQAGWLQTFASNTPDVWGNNVYTTPPGERIEERLDGYGVQQSTDLTRARYFDGIEDDCCGVASPILDDQPFRFLTPDADRSVLFRAQSSVIVNGQVPISVGWGFSIDSQNSHTSEFPVILNSTTPFHQSAVQSLINKTR